MKRKLIYSIRLFSKSRNIFLKTATSTYASSPVHAFRDIKTQNELSSFTNDTRKNIEKHWKDKINLHSYNEADTTKDKFYVLSMFPYPSGVLHMGHVRVYTISDTVARFHRLNGKNVIHPMGWDAFGLPAENAAIEKQVDPNDWTKGNIKTMKEQLNRLNYSFDWDREFATCDPEYYRWTQELFIKLFEKGLVYQKEDFVNWDPIDQTVLAEEQVDENNCSWRSGAKVEKKLLNQWFVRTTAFAKSLLEGLKDPTLREWKDIITIQKNWIGKCNGMSFECKLISDIPEYPKTINLWTSTPEFIEYAKFVAISPSSILNQSSHCQNVNNTIKLLNARVLNPFTKEELPVFVTNDVVFPSGRDTYLGIPSVALRDMQFTEQIGIPFDRHNISSSEMQQEKLSNVTNLAKKWGIGGYPVSSRLKDWLISRQRYWGTPIPIIHCKNCGAQPVPHDQLPVVLPKIDQSSNKKNTLLEVKEWLETSCPKCGESAIREADTMDTFVDSSWYYLRFIDPKNVNEMFSTEKVKKLFPVDLYIGGKEHAVLHLYYARFISHFLHSEGLVSSQEPFQQLLIQGMVMGQTYQVQSTGEYLREDQVEKVENKYQKKGTSECVNITVEKMSKSKFNGVNPINLMEKYGIDATRLLILADVAPTSHRIWSEKTFTGINNWQNRLWLVVRNFVRDRSVQTFEELHEKPTDPAFAKDDYYMFDSRNFFLSRVSYNITKAQQLSVAISRLQGLTNSFYKVSKECTIKSREFERALAVNLIMLAPFAPHFASELWANFCSVPHHLIDSTEVKLDKDVLDQDWPVIDMNYKLSLTIYINSQEFMKHKIPRYELDNLTVDKAVQLLLDIPKYQERIRKYQVIDYRLTLEKGWNAYFYVNAEKLKKEAVQ